MIRTETPAWFLKGSIYQINPRTFSSEGTICAVTRELPFLAEMGFQTIYLCPIFEEDDTMHGRSPRQLASETGNPKNPYRMNDYFTIDPEYGTMDDLKNCISEAHKLGLKVILDLVYYHIGPNAPVLKAHPNFAFHDENGNIEMTPWNFPKLNFFDAGLREYLWCNMTYYIGVLDADGFRCDVGDNVPLDFWQEGKRRIRTIKPDAVLLNEGVNWEYLEKCFDASYCWGWHDLIFQIVHDGASTDLLRQKQEQLIKNPWVKGRIMRDIDNHDTVTDWSDRIENLAGHEGMELITVMNYMIDGIPMVYCGNELCDTAKLSMFANRFYMGKFQTTDRSKKEEIQSLQRQKILKALNRLKKESDTLCYGDTLWIDSPYKDKVICFERKYQRESILFLGNFSADACNLPPVGEGIILLESIRHAIKSDKGITLPPYGYLVIKKS